MTSETPSSSWPILVVDDDPSVRTLFVTVLTSEGLPAIEAATGHEALEVVNSRRVGAVLLDAGLPGLDGIEVLRALRARPGTRTLPVIVVTGETEVAQRVLALEAGADDHLTKPVHTDELVARVRAQLRGQAEWLRVLGDRMHERTELMHRLAAQRPAATLARTAELICQQLAALPDLHGAAIVVFSAEGAATPLALHGAYPAHVQPNRPLPAAVARLLVDHAHRGPWLAPADWLRPVAADGETAYAPLLVRDQLIGVLAVTGSREPADAASRSLALAIDVAGVTAGLLAPLLGQWEEESTMRAGIDRLLTERAFVSVFQPIRALADLTVMGYEALTRFADGADPELKFAEAAQVGLGTVLETATIRQALQAANRLPVDASVSLNVSPRLLIAPGELIELVASAERPLILELTEHERIDDYAAVRSAVAELGAGIRLSIDDAGAGYASLTHVLALQPTFVKLDRRWVRGIERDPARQALVAGLRHFASGTGCHLVAEGIEREEELATLRSLEVELGQGFLLGRPEPATSTARG